jgi:hypothetical protein
VIAGVEGVGDRGESVVGYPLKPYEVATGRRSNVFTGNGDRQRASTERTGLPVSSLLDRSSAFFSWTGDLGLFGSRAIRESFRRPFEIGEIIKQIFEVGWRSGPLIKTVVLGFIIGTVSC